VECNRDQCWGHSYLQYILMTGTKEVNAVLESADNTKIGGKASGEDDTESTEEYRQVK